MSGWIKLHRKLLDNPIFKDSTLLHTFIYCLLRANHEPNEILFNGKTITLEPGQFITGRHQASKDLGFKSVMWDRKLEILQNLGILNKQVNNKFSLIHIVKWADYQINEQASEQQMNNKRTTNEQQMNTDKNDKNVKKSIAFIKPSIPEIQEYAKEVYPELDASAFWHSYESKGWKVGKSPMTNWKAAVITWKKNSGKYDNETKTSSPGYINMGKGEDNGQI